LRRIAPCAVPGAGLFGTPPRAAASAYMADEIDELIVEFNKEVGALE